MDNKQEPKVIKNASKANTGKFTYSYSSLADLAKADIKIPKMRIKPTEYGEYIEYLDENNEWQIGAKVVLLETDKMNTCQAYGSALTYARRYTVMLANAIACDDDEKVETAKPSTPKNLDFEVVRKELRELKNIDAVNQYSVELKREYPVLSSKQVNFLGNIFNERRAELGDNN